MQQAEITAMITPAVEALGYTCWGCEYIPQGRYSLLRVYIDSPNGINLDDCAKVSKQINAVLDVEDAIHGQYNLEVSSPGVERPLFSPEQYQQFIGKDVCVRLARKVAGRRKVVGQLQQVTDEQVVVQVDDAPVAIPFQAIEKANLKGEL